MRRDPLVALVLVACQLPPDPCDPDDDFAPGCDVDCDATPDDPACRTPETGVAILNYYGFARTSDGDTLDEGGLGLAFLADVDADVVCRTWVDWAHGATGPAGCPSCDWSFEPVATGDVPAEGDHCADLGVTDGQLRAEDWTLPMGFAAEYAWEDEGTTVENAVFLYLDGWFLFAGNVDGYVTVFGTGEHVEIYRPLLAEDGSSYYYAYDPG